jgi:hypothetical protein
MAGPRTHQDTAVLRAWTAGDEKALEKLTPLAWYRPQEGPGGRTALFRRLERGGDSRRAREL